MKEEPIVVAIKATLKQRHRDYLVEYALLNGWRRVSQKKHWPKFEVLEACRWSLFHIIATRLSEMEKARGERS